MLRWTSFSTPEYNCCVLGINSSVPSSASAACCVQVPSPLCSSIFMGAPDQLSEAGLDPRPLEHPCPKLDGYLFEADTPRSSPEPQLLTTFDGFSYVHQSELAKQASKAERLSRAF